MKDGLKVKPNALCKAHTSFKIYDEMSGAATRFGPKLGKSDILMQGHCSTLPIWTKFG